MEEKKVIDGEFENVESEVVVDLVEEVETPKTLGQKIKAGFKKHKKGLLVGAAVIGGMAAAILGHAVSNRLGLESGDGDEFDFDADFDDEDEEDDEEETEESEFDS